MEDESAHPIPPELTAMMDVEMSAAGLESPADQQRLRSLLEHLPGVESVSFRECRMAIRYDAERTANARICEVVTQAGFKFFGVETAPTHPSIDVLPE